MNLKLVPALILLALAAAPACTKAKKSDAPAIPERVDDGQAIDAQKSHLGIMDLTVDLRDDGLLLHIGQLPPDATLECDLDEKPLTPCHDGALFVRPAIGDHKISAVATKSGAIVALGESTTFTIMPSTTKQVGDVETHGTGDLALQIDDANFANGMTVPLSKDFTAHFRFASGTPSCAAQVRCKYDSRTSPFWTTCSEDGKSFTVTKDLLALGLQYLTVQAICGDQAGPELTLFWYGVPDNYQPLALTDVKDANGRHIVTLVKDDDCPESQQQFQCAALGSDAFALCPNGNVLDNPVQGSRIRLTCQDQTGPALTF